MLEVIEHAVHLVEVALGVVALLADLVAVGLADGARLVCPLVPDVGVEVVDVVGFALVDPKDLVHGALEGGAAEGEGGELAAQVIAVYHAKLLDGVGGGAVLPARADLLALGGGAVLDDVFAHGAEELVCLAHGFS